MLWRWFNCLFEFYLRAIIIVWSKVEGRRGDDEGWGGGRVVGWGRRRAGGEVGFATVEIQI